MAIVVPIFIPRTAPRVQCLVASSPLCDPILVEVKCVYDGPPRKGPKHVVDFF
jgi:hypothetical protein